MYIIDIDIMDDVYEFEDTVRVDAESSRYSSPLSYPAYEKFYADAEAKKYDPDFLEIVYWEFINGKHYDIASAFYRIIERKRAE